jgi:hypothetical protein
MNIIFFFICIPILCIYPILYPPIACFTATLFIRKNKLNYISLFFIFSSAIVSSLISATIIPVADTAIYIDSFQEINLFNFNQLQLNNNGFEPLYKIYEYLLSLFIDDSEKLFLLVTALIINILSTIGILRICLRLDQAKLLCMIFTVYYSLVAPALGVSLFLLRTSLSISFLILGISYYRQKHLLFYLFGIIAIFIHFYSLLIFSLFIVQSILPDLNKRIEKIGSKKLIDLTKIFILRFSLAILIVGFFTVILSPDLLLSNLRSFLEVFNDSGALAADKARSFLNEKSASFINFSNPVFIVHFSLSLLCFIKLRDDLLIRPELDKNQNQILLNFLESLRLIGRLLIIVIIVTAPFNFLPYRLGLFSFLYFPFYLINVPYVSLQLGIKKYSKYLILLSLVSVIAYTFYWMPKRQDNDYNIVVLENKVLDYNLVQVISFFL